MGNKFDQQKVSLGVFADGNEGSLPLQRKIREISVAIRNEIPSTTTWQESLDLADCTRVS